MRRNLEEHHIQYGWGRRVDAPYNVITLCRFHHQQGEHGLFMSCRGRMPLGVVFRLGLPEFATWYQNERIVDPLETEFRSDEFGPPGIAA